MRAYLIATPGSPGATAAACASEASALILDCADLKASPGAGFHGPLSSSEHRSRLFLRIGAVDGPDIAAELSAAMLLRPDAVVLPVAHGRDIAHLGARLAVEEAENGWPDCATQIIALIASAEGALNAGRLADAGPRLAGIGWDAGALAAELQAQGLDAAGGWSAPLAQVRGLVRLAAAAAHVEAIEAAYPGGDAGFARLLAAARRDGFGAVLAASPAQIPLIRQA